MVMMVMVIMMMVMVIMVMIMGQYDDQNLSAQGTSCEWPESQLSHELPSKDLPSLSPLWHPCSFLQQRQLPCKTLKIDFVCRMI